MRYGYLQLASRAIVRRQKFEFTRGSMTSQSRAWLMVLSVILAQPVFSSEVEVDAIIVNGLGEPVTGVSFDIKWSEKENSESQAYRTHYLLRLRSDQNGRIRGQYSRGHLPTGETEDIALFKSGYKNYTTSGLRPKYTLKPRFREEQLHEALALPHEEKKTQLRSMLAGEWGLSAATGLAGAVFAFEKPLRQALVDLLADPLVGQEAAELLIYIGESEIIEMILSNSFSWGRVDEDSSLAPLVASALVNPSSPTAWAFLERCVSSSNPASVRAAFQTLRLNATKKSLAILMSAKPKSEYGREKLRSVIEYVSEHQVPALDDPDLEHAARKVGLASGLGDLEGVQVVRMNQDSDKALVYLSLLPNEHDLVIYAGTFHKMQDVWVLAGLQLEGGFTLRK